MSEARPRHFEIHQLVELFRQALVAVGPLAEKAGVNWLQYPAYDDWDAVTEGMFRTFVLSALENSDVSSRLGNMSRYGFEPDEASSHLVVTTAGRRFAFIDFAGGDRLMSKATVMDEMTRERQVTDWAGSQVHLRLPDGTLVSHIEVTP